MSSNHFRSIEGDTSAIDIGFIKNLLQVIPLSKYYLDLAVGETSHKGECKSRSRYLDADSDIDLPYNQYFFFRCILQVSVQLHHFPIELIIIESINVDVYIALCVGDVMIELGNSIIILRIFIGYF